MIGLPDGEGLLDAGFDGYIAKPIDIRGFADQVQRAIAGQAPAA